ncbi:hypothetical protein AB1Y20_007740 [Prymnesium parvum]|uniref:Major facilitator superfamily (MFS) profile domain-containing protein n=1 Tax=Prymnesium parvum TaxID=97485 RepID=A0AB34IY14_PRYPA
MKRTEYVLLLAVFIDLFGVALVVPNILFLFKEALGERFSPELYGMVSSVYSASQIVGGVALGYLGDSSWGRKRTLLLSFAGAAASYFLVGAAESLELLVLSRVIVGLVKQTMTASTALLTQRTRADERAGALGRLSSASTLAFLAGQPAGGVLAVRFGRRTPCYLASALFVVDFALVQLCLPAEAEEAEARGGGGAAAAAGGGGGGGGGEAAAGGGVGGGARGVIASVRRALRGEGARVLVLRLSYGFLMRASYALHGMYEQQRWELTPSSSGYLSSYKQGLGLALNALLIGRLARCMSTARLLELAIALSAANSLLEAAASSFPAPFALYVGVNLPVSAICGALIRTLLSTLFSQAVPASDAGLALSVFDVLSAASGIVAPLYSGFFLGRIGVAAQPVVAFAHYVIIFAVARYCLADVSSASKRKNE